MLSAHNWREYWYFDIDYHSLLWFWMEEVFFPSSLYVENPELIDECSLWLFHFQEEFSFDEYSFLLLILFVSLYCDHFNSFQSIMNHYQFIILLSSIICIFVSIVSIMTRIDDILVFIICGEWNHLIYVLKVNLIISFSFVLFINIILYLHYFCLCFRYECVWN